MASKPQKKRFESNLAELIAIKISILIDMIECFGRTQKRPPPVL